jgi:hypothetical protein
MALQNQNGPYIDGIVGLPLGSEVLIWQIHKKRWIGLYKLLAIQDKTATVQLPHRLSRFRTTSIK